MDNHYANCAIRTIFISNLRKWVCSTCKHITASQRDNTSMWWDPAGSRMPCCERTASCRASEKTWVIKSLKPPQLLPVKTVAKLMLPSNTNTVWARREIFNQIHWQNEKKKRLWVTLWGLDFREIVIEDIWVRYIISRTKPKHRQKSPADKSSPFLKMLCPIDNIYSVLLNTNRYLILLIILHTLLSLKF